ncbi:MAG: M23 family metallopeptidase [Flavobacterium sp.]|nr:M23 family metallopeptidase [Flavobacterium sp.]
MRFIYAFILFSVVGFAQNEYPKDYFGSPLDIPLNIAGSFGELRPSHFHSGIDFRTQQKEGFPVYATADGFISRINVSTFGYGKCLYIDHPNGFTSVYAHLQNMAPKIQSKVLEVQYAEKSYVTELRPKPEELQVKKGELIGYTGNTGGSNGPHLHFEIRDTKSEFAINPFFFGYDEKVKDTKAPVITGLMAYSFGDSSHVNGSARPVVIPLTLQSDGTYLAGKIVASGTIGFGLNAHDISDYNFGKNGIFKLDAFLNGMPYYGYEFDTFSFDESKHINCFIDYPRYKETKQRYQKLFVGFIYPKSIIKTMKNQGILDISNNLTMNYKIVVHDFHGNQNIINIPINYGILPITQAKVVKKTPFFLKCLNEHSYAKDNFSVFIPENTFYEDFYLKFDVQNNELFLNEEDIAMNTPLTITYDATSIPESEREKWFIANIDDGKIEYNATFKKENTFSIKVKKMGKFLLAKDTIAPKVYNPNFKEGAELDANQKTIKISISDDLSGIKEYTAFLNEKWILMEYETKLKRLTHNLSDNMFSLGRNDFKIIVKDNMGNSTTFESYFIKTN